ncbi:hypothetical protein [Amycolatopsis antarctica]|nr:hypothetical protein [Amycolatopsis antarctica]
MDSGYGNRTYQSIITAPGGVQVSVTITVPETLVWKDSKECAELAQMAASHGMALVDRSRAERAPF